MNADCARCGRPAHAEAEDGRPLCLDHLRVWTAEQTELAAMGLRKKAPASPDRPLGGPGKAVKRRSGQEPPGNGTGPENEQTPRPKPGGPGATEAERAAHATRWARLEQAAKAADREARRLQAESRMARVAEIRGMRVDGMTWPEIVELTGLSRARLSQLCPERV